MKMLMSVLRSEFDGPEFEPHITVVCHWSHLLLGHSISDKGWWSFCAMAGAHGILTVEPSNIEYMLISNFNKFPKGKSNRERFYDLLGDGIFNADVESWRGQRRIAVSEMHSSHVIKHSIQTMQNLVQHKLLRLLGKLINSDHSFDLQEQLLQFTIDNICVLIRAA